MNKRSGRNYKANRLHISLAQWAMISVLIISTAILTILALIKSIETDNAKAGIDGNNDLITEEISEVEDHEAVENPDNNTETDTAVGTEVEESTIAKEETLEGEAAEPELTDEEILENEIEAKLSEMSLEEKLYQLFVVTPEQLTGVTSVVAAGGTTRSSLEKYPVGGIVYFAANFVSVDQTKEMLTNTQEYAEEIEGLPLFLCVDEEGGTVTRIARNPDFGVKDVGAMGDVTSEEDAYACGDTIGKYLADTGLNVDFAPDADVLTNDKNTVIGDRSFGSDPDIVSDYAKAYSDGLHQNGIMSTYKHFPGHGATEADTHKGYAYTDKTYDELMESELIPFVHAGEYGVDMIMAAHISVPNVVGDDTPCSVSKKMITDILREELSYNGLIITDALNMGAISENYSSSSAAVKAISAGVDLLLMPGDLQAAYEGLHSAVEDGTISEERIDESLRRIIRAKLLLDKEDEE